MAENPFPDFEFNAKRWLTDDISSLPLESQAIFAQICAYYWTHCCCVDLNTMKLRFANFTESFNLFLKKKQEFIFSYLHHEKYPCQ